MVDSQDVRGADREAELWLWSWSLMDTDLLMLVSWSVLSFKLRLCWAKCIQLVIITLSSASLFSSALCIDFFFPSQIPNWQWLNEPVPSLFPTFKNLEGCFIIYATLGHAALINYPLSDVWLIELRSVTRNSSPGNVLARLRSKCPLLWVLLFRWSPCYQTPSML